MRTKIRVVCACLGLAALGWAAQAWTAPAAPGGGVGRAPTPGQWRGPNGYFLYKNDDGVFEIDPSLNGSAKYRWKDGQAYIDNMRFVREATFYTDDESHKGWIYEATGNGVTWWLFFGATPMGKDEQNEDLFPLYFSQEDPTKNKFDRWRTRSGTTRLTLPVIGLSPNVGRLQ